jgi:uncharacterized protein (TIGR01777 family)
MKIVVAGGSGFLGTPLRRDLVNDGHTVVNLTRDVAPTAPGDVTWTPDGTAGAWATALNGADAVVNLAGTGIADKRWSDARKQAIRSSRLRATRSLVAACVRSPVPPRAFVSASAVGYYGPHGDERVTEATPAGTDFLADVCVEWEREAAKASAATRVAIVRTGLVLHPEGGALRPMLLPFKLGVGGPIASGRQFMPWIHRDDWSGLVRWLISHRSAQGPFNASAPEPVTSKEFAQSLGRALHRPAILPVPAVALRLLLGEMADLLVTGHRAVPSRALEIGFPFRFTRLDDALRDLLQ